MVGPYDDIVWDARVTQQVDWEAELGVIIGVGGKNIRREDAMSHVFGYTVINDVSARDLQSAHVQFFKGKSLDTFCPMGPVIVTADEFGDPQRKAVKLRVNGVEKQNGNTADMIFPIDQTIEVLSRGLHDRAGRHHLDRHTRRCRHGTNAAGMAPGRRRDGNGGRRASASSATGSSRHRVSLDRVKVDPVNGRTSGPPGERNDRC